MRFQSMLHSLFPWRRPVPAGWFAVLLAALVLAPASQAAVTSIVVSPGSVSLIHGQTQQFAAVVTVTSGSSTAVFWTISPTIGSITSTGLYEAPASVFQTQTITVTATSQADTTKRATATVTLTPTVAVTAINPSNPTLAPGEQQQFTATVSGTSNTNVTWAIVPDLGNLTPSGLYTAPTNVANRQTVTITAISVADPTKSRSTTIVIQPIDAVAIVISPTSVTLSNNGVQQFAATVTNGATAAVLWTISPSGVGSITQEGLYTGPAIITGTQTVRVTAQSVADGTKTATATITLTTISDIGSGAPNMAIATVFRSAFYRGNFRFYVTLPPATTVRRLGTVGLVQEFTSATVSSQRYALILPNQNNVIPVDENPVVYQFQPEIYSYYTSVGATTAGYPIADSVQCSFFDTANSCYWAEFTLNYALFAYKVSLFNGQNFAVSGNFYTKWKALGGINGLGRAVEAQTAVTASTTSTATVQTFANGAVYQYTNGPNNGRYFGVMQPLYGLYRDNGGPAGRLGFPTADEVTLTTGVHRQTFQGGTLEYTPGSDPTLRLPVSSIALVASTGLQGTVNMKLGDSITVTAKPGADNSTDLPGRTVSWSTSNSKVVSIQATNEVAVLKAVGGGSAAITASSEGVVSPRINILVTAPCCQVGESAPGAVQQAFQEALTRARLPVTVPVETAAARVGSGYLQIVQSSDAARPGAYMLAKGDKVGAAYVVGGDLLKKYQELGGASGTLGYPTSDATAGGRQMFEHGALAGSPALVVSGLLLNKWAQLGYETGAAGSPAGVPAPFATTGANTGSSQAFTGGVLYAASGGPRTGQAYLCSGLILARYLALNGPSGAFGMPVSDEVGSGLRQQNFEGGTIEYAPGDTEARERVAERSPTVLATPATVIAGGRVRLSVFGFPARSPIRVSLTGQADFQINNDTGAYSWDLFIPLATTTRTLEVRAVDTRGTAAASASIAVKGLAENRVQLVKVSGDNQAGVPGGLLARPLRVALRDTAGSAVAGAQVAFEASPGASLSASSAVTDANGEAEVHLRMPASAGIALVKADSPSIAINPVTFGAVSAERSLSNFPKLLAAGEAAIGAGPDTIGRKGALLAAIASILRFHQNAGDLRAPNGTADPATLNQFLKTTCPLPASGLVGCDGFLANPEGGDQVVNLWRVAEFAGGAVEPAVAKGDTAGIADWLALGSPVLLSLAVSSNGVPAGGHFVVATGITAEGGILVHDPLSLARTSLSELLNGFSAAGTEWKAELRGIVRFVLRTPAQDRFLVAAVSQPPAALPTLDLRSVSGSCGVPLDLADAAPLVAPGTAATRVSRFLACDGANAAYQLSAAAGESFRLTVTDLNQGGAATALTGAGDYRIARSGPGLAVGPLQLAFDAASVVNAASFTSGLAPGSLMAIFGSGLAGSKSNTTVELGGKTARVVYASSFQINAQVPLDVAPGVHALNIRSDVGTMSQSVEIREVAPSIFVLGNGRGAVVNQNGTLNSPTSPLSRGQTLLVYATGLGAVRQSGQLSVAVAPVLARLGDIDVTVSFAGLAPGFVGLYQVNVPIPANTLPGLETTLALKVGGVVSDPVSVSIQ